MKLKWLEIASSLDFWRGAAADRDHFGRHRRSRHLRDFRGRQRLRPVEGAKPADANQVADCNSIKSPMVKIRRN